MGSNASQLGRGKHRRRRWLIVAVVLVPALALAVKALLPTRQERLAAIDAKRAVADEDNAALIYAELFRGERVPPSDMETALVRIEKALLNPVSFQEFQTTSRKLAALEVPEGLLDPNDEERALLGSWTSSEFPELRQWLDTHRDRTDRLMEAAAKPSCYFPLLPGSNQVGLVDVPTGAFGQNARLLRRAANNDMGEDRIADGLAKYRAIVSMGRHFQAQPARYPVLTGISCEAMGLHHLIVFAVTGPVMEGDLDLPNANSNDLKNQWESIRHDISRVRNVLAGKLKDPRPLKFRLYEWYVKLRHHDEGWNEDRVSELYHRVLCERRAYSIVVELRRFKNRTGHWPEQLDEIAPALDPLASIDPQNGGLYLYRVDQTNGFELYSAGPDGKDDRRHQGSDDWPIWPRNGGLRRQNPNALTTYESVKRAPEIKKGD